MYVCTIYIKIILAEPLQKKTLIFTLVAQNLFHQQNRYAENGI